VTPDLDPDRRLALAYAPARARPALEALWRLDVTLGAVVAKGREPMVARIRLAWWREALERLDGAPPPPEPVLQALAAHLLPAGIRGAELAAIEEGWSILLAEGRLDADALQAYARLRGGLLFRFSARLLGAAEDVEPAGARWALVDLARHSRNPAEAAAALQAAAEMAGRHSWPKSLRPLAMLALLARRDLERPLPLERPGSPGRMLRLIRFRLSGR
jgi:phytoene synthase